MFFPEEKAKKENLSASHLTSFSPFREGKAFSQGSFRRKIDLLEVYFRKPPLKKGQKEALAAFAATIPGFRIRLSTQTGLPLFIKGKPLYQPFSPGMVSDKKSLIFTTALEALEHYRGLMRLENPRKEFLFRKEIIDDKGRHHLRLSQYYQGLRYFGKELTVHLNPDGSVYLIAGHYAETPKSLDTSPRISAFEACELIRSQFNSAEDGCQETELVISEDQVGIPHLTWRVDLCRTTGDCWRFFLDAHTGEILKRYRLWARIAVPGSAKDLEGRKHQFSVWKEGNIYYFIDTSHPYHQKDPIVRKGILGRGNLVLLTLPFGEPQNQDWLTSSDPNQWPPEAVTIWYHLKLTYDYYWRTYGRCGMDGRCQNAVGAFPLRKANAFYTSYNDFIFLGEGDGSTLGPFYALDIIAHEFTHGIIHYTADLEYLFQSGALNEALSDIFAVMVDRKDWLIGEDVVLVPPYNLRNLADPHKSLTPLPASMEEYQVLSVEEDNGGVHLNSTIPAHLIYLLSEELGLKREKVERLCYKALTEFLTPQSNFEDFCLALEQAADELFGKTEVQAVREACNRVGITVSADGAEGQQLPPLPGKDFVLFIFYQLEDGEPIPYIGELTPEGKIYYLSETPAFESRPAPYIQNGAAWALFVDREHNLRAANIESSSYQEIVLNDSGEIWSVTTTPTAELIAFTSIRKDDPHIYLYRPQTNQVKVVALKFQPPDATLTLETFFPDVVAFGPAGQKIFFDCFNKVRLGQEDYLFWSIGVLNLVTGKTKLLFSVPPQGYHLGNPVAAHLHPDLLAFDLLTENHVKTMILNLRNNQTGIAWTGAKYDGLGTSGWPSFSGDDTSLYLQDFDPFYAEVLIKVPLRENGGIWNGDQKAAKLVLADWVNRLGILRPVAFRKGTISVSPRAEVSTQKLDFGKVPIGKEKDLALILKNIGSYPLQFLGSNIEGPSVFAIRAAHTTIPPGQSYTIEVAFKPKKAGTFKAILHLFTSDPQKKDIPVILEGIGYKEPKVKVYVNGSGAPKVVRDRLRITISLDPQGFSGLGDYFLWAKIPEGSCYCYIYPGKWELCSCAQPLPAYQGRLIFLKDFWLPPEFLAAQLPAGPYQLYFAVDENLNGVLDPYAVQDKIIFQIEPLPSP